MAAKSSRKIYHFKIIEFLSEEHEKGSSSADFDIVPAKWIEYVPTNGSMITKFPDGPYTNKRSKVIHAMVKNLQDPLADWPTFAIDIRGEAGI